MKSVNLIFNVILSIAVVVLFVLFLGQKGDVKQEESVVSSVGSGDLKIAYVQIDSLLVNLMMAQDLNKEFVGKRTEYEQEYGRKRQKFEQEAAEFQQKLQRGGFLSEQRAASERDRIMSQSQEIQQLDYELSNKLAQMEAEMNEKITSKILDYIKEYNTNKKYNYILSNSGNIIVGDQSFNITNEILIGLNEQYEKKE